MWFLLWTRLGRRVIFWCKLFSVASIGHVFLLFMILFVYSGQKSVFTVNINRSVLKSGAPIIFMPRIAKQIATQGTVLKKKPSNKGRSTCKRAVMKKPVPKKNIKKIVKKSGLVKKKAPVKKLANKKAAPKKPIKKPVKKPVAQRKKPQKRPVKKLVKKKPVPKKPGEKIEKKVAPAKQEKIDQKDEKPTEKKMPALNATQETQVQAAAEAVESQESHPEAIYIGQQELEAIKVQYEIEHEVSKYWRPPVGLSKELSCTITVLVDWNGTAKKVTVTKTSGALMFDIAARTAVSKLNLPKSVCGKEVNVNFGQ